MPARPWMSYVLSDTTAPRLARFAREVFGVEEADNRKAAELGITESVQFLGNQGNPQDYYQAMDLFIFPSLYEGCLLYTSPSPRD